MVGTMTKIDDSVKKKVPELRFKGFTDDWEERKLGDVTTWTKGQGLTKEDLNEERDGSEAVHYADLYKFSPVMHNVIHWTNSDDGRIIPDNSLLFPASDVTPVGLARTSTLRLSGVKAGGDVIIGQLDESINSSFMSYQINANSKKILPLITGTTVKHVQAKSLATVSVSITNMAEQTAIAGIFERIDNLIALHQRKLDLLKEQKKGFLQKMFPKNGAKVPELRFAGFADDWEQRKLGEFSDVRDGTHASPKYVSQGHPMVTSKNLTHSGLDMTDVSFLTDKDFNEINKRSKVSIGDILFGMIGTIGNPVIVDRDDFAIKNVALIKEKTSNPITNKWLLQYLKSPSFNRFIQKENAGGTQKFIALGLIRDMKLRVPEFDEQQKIGSFFKQLDNTIEHHQRKLDLLKDLKKGLSQQMFV